MRALRWLGLLSAMLMLGGYVAVCDAASASLKPEKTRVWMTSLAWLRR
ncbi:hypothetical protein PS898_04850 [Pseudomonas fluorescens]|nr:hypothetical protein PS898_04850 [Pseudomonas fluorescens]